MSKLEFLWEILRLCLGILGAIAGVVWLIMSLYLGIVRHDYPQASFYMLASIWTLLVDATEKKR